MRLSRKTDLLLPILGLLLLLSVHSAYPMGKKNSSSGGAGEDKVQRYLDSGDIRIVCAGKTGGTADVVTRAIARYLEKAVGKTVSVENKNGANGMVALTEYMSQRPNTTTLQVMFNNPFTLMPLFDKVPLSLDDIQPIIGMDSQQRILYVNAKKTGINTFDELIAYGTANFIPFGSGGNANQFAILQRALYNVYDIESDLIVEKGFMASLLGGHIVSAVDSPQSGQTYVAEGSIKPIAVFGDEPYTKFEGYTVPTAKSLGFDAYAVGYRFIHISKGTDAEIVDFWYQTFKKIFEDPEFMHEMEPLDALMTSHDPETVAATLNRMLESHKSLMAMIQQ